MKIAIGADHGGFEYKEKLISRLVEWGFEVEDFGVSDAESSDYADVAEPVCLEVRDGSADFGILICGTGIGMSIAANKIRGIRCALCSESYSARMTREHNNANILSMGARVIGIDVAIEVMYAFLHTQFSNDERHIRRISKISDIEKRMV